MTSATKLGAALDGLALRRSPVVPAAVKAMVDPREPRRKPRRLTSSFCVVSLMRTMLPLQCHVWKRANTILTRPEPSTCGRSCGEKKRRRLTTSRSASLRRLVAPRQDRSEVRIA